MDNLALQHTSEAELLPFVARTISGLGWIKIGKPSMQVLFKHKDAYIRDLNNKGNKSKRCKGQQKGTPGPGRTPCPNLPEIIPLIETACGLCDPEFSLPSSIKSPILLKLKWQCIYAKNMQKMLRKCQDRKLLQHLSYPN